VGNYLSNLHFLFPSHPLRPTLVEEIFADQFAAVQAAGFSASLCPDSVIQDGKPLRSIPGGSVVVYRGWMLNAAQYGRLVAAIEQASATPLTSTDSYLRAHHLPNWFLLIPDLTPETHVFSLAADWEAELRTLGWDAFFIKDYVKSLKTARGSIVRDPSEIAAVVAEMKEFRGEIEGGLCVRRVELLLPESERRYFVVKGQSYAPDGGAVPGIVLQAAERIDSPYFSVDVVEREDGVPRIVEIGDGQVSDLVGWSAAAFTAMWKAAVRL
jgi:hypothetical protein